MRNQSPVDSAIFVDFVAPSPTIMENGPLGEYKVSVTSTPSSVISMAAMSLA